VQSAELHDAHSEPLSQYLLSGRNSSQAPSPKLHLECIGAAPWHSDETGAVLTNDAHDASASALGYFYQSQWPLVEIVRRASERPDLKMAIEMYDDVSWEEDGMPVELLQIKHHIDSVRTLGDKDLDLWRTIASWMDAHRADDPDGPTLTLVTTQAARPGTACSCLRPISRDTVEGKRLLDLAARESTSTVTSAVRQRYLALTDSQRSIFVGRIFVLDGAFEIDNLGGELRKLLHLALPHGHEEVFLDRLWAWWYRVVVTLLKRQSTTISALEVTQYVSDLRDTFTADNLPTLVDIDDFDPASEVSYSGRVFVEQLRWISLSAPLLQKAIVDYYRAYTQSSRWIEDHLVGLNELDSYEANLRDEWERSFEFMLLRLGPSASSERIDEESQSLFLQVTEQCGVRVRDRYNEVFFTRGKYHELADDGRVGWHPEFGQRLKDLLLGQAS
jgi:hypothetical protein